MIRPFRLGFCVKEFDLFAKLEGNNHFEDFAKQISQAGWKTSRQVFSFVDITKKSVTENTVLLSCFFSSSSLLETAESIFFSCVECFQCQFDIDCNYHFTVAFLATFGGNLPPHIEFEVPSKPCVLFLNHGGTCLDSILGKMRQIELESQFFFVLSDGSIGELPSHCRKFFLSSARRSMRTISRLCRNTESVS